MGLPVAGLEFDIVPNASGWERAIRSQLLADADRIGKATGSKISEQIAKELRDSVGDGLKQARPERPASEAGRRAGDAFAGAFDRDVRTKVERALRSLPDAKIGADASQAEKSVDRIRRQLEKLADKRVGIDVSEGDATRRIQAIESALEKLDREDVSVDVRFNAAAARAALEGISGQAKQAGEQAGEEFGGAFDRSLRHRIKAAADSLPEIPVDLDSSPAERALSEIRGELSQLGEKRIGVDIDRAAAIAALEEIDGRLEALNSADADVAVKVDSAAAQTELQAVMAEVRRLDGKRAEVDVHADTGSARAELASLATEANRGSSGMALLVAAAMSVAPALMPIGGAAIGVAGALGMMAAGAGAAAGVVVLAIAPVVKAMEALSAADDASAQTAQSNARAQESAARQIAQARRGVADAEKQAAAGVAQAREQERSALRAVEQARRGVADAEKQAAADVARAREQEKDALRGVEQARRGVADAEKQAAAGVAQAREQERSALRAVEQARRGVADAEKQAAADVARAREQERAALRAVEQAQRSVADARRQAADGVTNALAAQERAERSVEQAQQSSRQAQEGLNRARQTAADQLRELAQRAEEYALREEGAQISVDRARERLKATLSDKKASALDRREAELSVKEALAGQRRVAEEAARARAEQQAAQKAGVEGSRTYQEALARVADAQGRVRQAQAEYARAGRDVERARVEGAQRVADAQERLADAQRKAGEAHAAISDAQAKGTERVAQAQERLAEARRRAGEAHAAISAAEEQGAQRVADAQERLADAQRKAGEAHAAISDAQAKGTERVAQAQERVRQAQESAAKAHAAIATQQAEGAQRVADAQERLAQAQAAAAQAAGAQSAAQMKARDAMAALTPAGVALVHTLRDLAGVGDQLSRTAQAAMFPGLIQAIDLLRPALPGVTALVGRFSAVLGGLAVEAARGLTGPVWRGIMTTFARDLPEAMAIGARTTGQFATGVGSLLAGMSPVFMSLARSLEQASAQFARWAAEVVKTEGFRQFMAYIKATAPLVGELLLNLVGVVVNLTRAFAPMGPTVLRAVNALARFLATVDPKVLAGIAMAVAGVAAAIGMFGPLISVIVGVSAATEALRPLFTALSASAAAAGTTVGGLVAPFALAAAAVVGFTALVVTLYKTNATFRAACQEVWRAVGQVIKTVWVEIVKPVLSALVDFVRATVVPVFQSFGTTVAQVIRAVVIPVLNGFVVLLRQVVGPAVRWLLESIVRPVLTAIGALFRLWWAALVKPHLDALVWVLRNVVGPAVSWLYSNIFRPVLTAIGQVVAWWWRTLVKPPLEAFVWVLKNTVAPIVRWLLEKVIRPTFDAAGRKISDWWHQSVSPLLALAGRGFRLFGDSIAGVVRTMGETWSRGLHAMRGPVDWVVKHALNPLISAYNRVMGAVGGARIEPIQLAEGGRAARAESYAVRQGSRWAMPALAVGGTVPGWSPNDEADNIPAWLTAEEEVIRVRSARRMRREHPGALEYINEHGTLPPAYAAGGRVWPTTSRRLSGNYSGHSGIDIPVPIGTPVFAAGPGTVQYVGTGKGYGIAVFQSLPNGLRAVYGHNSQPLVRVGQQVAAGQVIARSGNTGRSTGPHVHFEVAPGGFNTPSNRAATLQWLGGAALQGGGTGSALGFDPIGWLKSMAGGSASWILEKASGALGKIRDAFPATPYLGMITGAGTKVIEAVKAHLMGLAEENGAATDSDASAVASSGGGVQRWRGLMTQMLARYGQPTSLVELGLRRLAQESGGNPNIQNNWDVNAKRGTPSRGLMQVIAPTFARWRDPALPNNILDPAANIAASIRYTLNRYGSLARGWGRPGGYADGGQVQRSGVPANVWDIGPEGGYLPPGFSIAYNGLGKPEPLVRADLPQGGRQGAARHAEYHVHTHDDASSIMRELKFMEQRDLIMAGVSL